jgi:hypothetical protein
MEDIKTFKMNGCDVKTKSLRYDIFNNSITCVTCGIGGSYFALEKIKHGSTTNRYHANLYAVKDGEEVLMTKDHIIPKSKGGKDHQSNLQTMCHVCNQKKGNK